MVDDPEDKWSYGVAADDGAEASWPPPSPGEPGAGDTARLHTGRWTSPSLGAYEPTQVDPLGADPRHDAYFQEYGAAGPDPNHGPDPAYGHGVGGNGASAPVFDDPDPGLDDEAEEGSSRGGEARRNAIEWAVVLVGAVLLALILRAVLLQAFYIPSPSM